MATNLLSLFDRALKTSLEDEIFPKLWNAYYIIKSHRNPPKSSLPDLCHLLILARLITEWKIVWEMRKFYELSQHLNFLLKLTIWNVFKALILCSISSICCYSWWRILCSFSALRHFLKNNNLNFLVLFFYFCQGFWINAKRHIRVQTI